MSSPDFSAVIGDVAPLQATPLAPIAPTAVLSAGGLQVVLAPTAALQAALVAAGALSATQGGVSSLSAQIAQLQALGLTLQQAEAIAVEVLDMAISGGLLDAMRSCEANSRRPRYGRVQLWNVPFNELLGSTTTYFDATAGYTEIARGTVFAPTFRLGGVIDFEVDGELDVVSPEIGPTLSFALETCPIPSAYPEVWTQVATWSIGGDPSLVSTPRQWWTRGRIRSRGQSGSTFLQTWRASGSMDPVVAIPYSPHLEIARGKCAIDTRGHFMLRITHKIDGVPSASRRSTAWGSYAEFCPRDHNGN